jgi:DNA-binding LacI/PurR family transcriptional regulator
VGRRVDGWRGDGVRRLVERFPALDGVPAYNDIMAIGAIRALEDLGRPAPEEWR